MSGVQSGPYNPQPANLLGMASQAQDIQRSQLAVQTGKQALANTQQNEFAQHLFAVNQLPDAQVVPWAQQLLQHAISTGTMDPQHEGMFGDIINSGDVGKIRTLANLGAIGNLAGPDAMNALARPVNVVNTGGALTNVTSPSTAERLPFAPGGANPQPTFGASTPTTLSPEGQAAQVARPATTQDVSDFAARGVTIQPGQAITENMRQRLLQQGGGGLLPGATPGAPGPQAPAFAPPAVPQRTVPPMAASGQPIGPQNPAGLGGGAQGAVVTGLPPSQPAEVAASADLFNKEQASSADFFTRDQQQGAALGALRTASTGPGTDFTNHLKSFALAMAPDVASTAGIDPTKIADFDTAKKYLTAIATSTPGAAGSDLRTSLSQMSNPSTEISNKAAVHIMATIQGLSRMRQAAFQQFAQANTVPGTGVNGVPPQLVPGASQNFGAFATSFSAKNDYRAFTPMTDDEFQAQIKSLTPQERPRFAASYAIAKQEGFQE